MHLFAELHHASPISRYFCPRNRLAKNDQMPIECDDLHAQSWNTKFGPNPFEDNAPEYSQNAEDIEYQPSPVPENNHPLSGENSQNGRAAQWNRPLNLKKITKTKSRRKTMIMRGKFPKNP